MSVDITPPAAPAQNGTRTQLVVTSSIPVLDTAMFEQMQRAAGLMARSPLVPDHLKGETFEVSVANCFLVVNQAIKWKMDPLAVAQATYVLHGKLGYEGKLVAAALQSCLGIRLYPYWTGAPGTPEYKITLRDKPEGEKTNREVTGTVAQWQTREKSGAVNQSWLKQPDDMLLYRATRQWARRYAPEVILGVLTDDEIEEIAARKARDVTPKENRTAPALPPPPVPMVPPVPSAPAARDEPAPAPAAEAKPAPADTKPKPEPVTEAEVVDEMLPDPDNYLTDLDQRMTEAEDADELHEIWNWHLGIAHRIPEGHQKRARKMHFEAQKRFIEVAEPA